MENNFKIVSRFDWNEIVIKSKIEDNEKVLSIVYDILEPKLNWFNKFNDKTDYTAKYHHVSDRTINYLWNYAERIGLGKPTKLINLLFYFLNVKYNEKI